ncbi:MAG: hypothetical protein JWM42_1748 [Burkholderia sp.]|jgi:hypothetical protein|nr:hypothetical protein [Burkholderia sp.]
MLSHNGGNLYREKMTNTTITPGVYEHYKGKKYFVLGLSRNTESNEVCVVYRPLYETDWPQLVHRNAAMFFEHVAVDGTVVPRFRLIA